MSLTDSRRMERISYSFDFVFRNLPFVSVKQAHTVRKRADLPVTEEEWVETFDQITAEYKANEAREELCTGWKQW